MPSKSKKQHNLMEMIAHSPRGKYGKKMPSKKVAKEFVQADKKSGKFRKKGKKNK